MSIILIMLALALLVAVAVFLHAVNSAPDGTEGETGFVFQPSLSRQFVSEETGLLKTDRGPLGRMTAVATARD